MHAGPESYFQENIQCRLLYYRFCFLGRALARVILKQEAVVGVHRSRGQSPIEWPGMEGGI